MDQLRPQEWVPWEPEVSGGGGLESEEEWESASGQHHPASISIQALLGL